jgi:hypothetical protein
MALLSSLLMGGKNQEEGEEVDDDDGDDDDNEGVFASAAGLEPAPSADFAAAAAFARFLMGGAGGGEFAITIHGIMDSETYFWRNMVSSRSMMGVQNIR